MKTAQKNNFVQRLVSSTITKITLLAVLMFGAGYKANACSPLVVPTMLSYSVVGNDLILNWESTNVWLCNGYFVEVEIVCDDKSFTGNGPFYMSPVLDKTATPQAYPQQTVNLSSFCPGKVYKLRARETYTFGGFSAWSQTFTFVTQGNFVLPTLNLSASSNIVCPPQTSTLNAAVTNSCGSQPFSYTWMPSTGLSNTNTANPVASITANTTYTCIVEGGDLGCWTISSSITLSLNTDPPVAGSATAQPAVICTGLTTTVTLSNHVGNIQWRTGPSSSGPWTNIPGASSATLVTPPLTANTCYQAQVASCTGTTFANPVCITVNPIPTITPFVSQPNCATPSGIVSYTNTGASGSPNNVVWLPAPNSVNSVSSSATYTSYTGQVTATISFPDGCVATANFSINPMPPLPNFTIQNLSGSNDITCFAPSITFSAATNYTYGSLNYFWQHPSATYSVSSITTTAQGNYTVTLTDPATFCSVTRTIAVGMNTVAPVSVLTPTFQNITCANPAPINVTLTASSPTINFTHQVLSPVGGTFSSGSVSVVYQPGPGTYTHCLINNVNGCSTCKEFTVNPGTGFPTFSLTSERNFTLGCNSRSFAVVAIINASTQPIPGGAVSYTLLPPNASSATPSGPLSSISVYTLTTPGTWTAITKDNATFCETRVPFSIIQNTLAPSIDSVAVPYQILSCAVPSTQLRGISNTPNISYNWSFNKVPGNLAGDTISVFANLAATTTTLVDSYTLTLTDNSSTCASRTVVPILQNVYRPKALISNGGTSSITCLTPTITLTNASSTGILPNSIFPSNLPVVGFLWEGPSPQIPANNVSTYLASVVGIYTLTAKDLNNGCTSSTITEIGDNRIYPVVNNPNKPDDFIMDCGAESVTITPIITSPLANLSYQWIAVPGATVTGVNSLVLRVNQTGEYQIVVTNTLNGCRSTGFVTVIDGTLHADFTPDNVSGFAPMEVKFTNDSRSVNNSSIVTVWSFGNGSSVITPQASVSPVSTYYQPGTYSVTMYATKGTCKDSVTKIINVESPSEMIVPNIFSPNGDGVNDLFILQRSANITEINAQIFDRWGHKVYELNTSVGQIEWDGMTQAGKEAPEGSYFYIIKAKGSDGKGYDLKGTVTLTR